MACFMRMSSFVSRRFATLFGLLNALDRATVKRLDSTLQSFEMQKKIKEWGKKKTERSVEY